MDVAGERVDPLNTDAYMSHVDALQVDPYSEVEEGTTEGTDEQVAEVPAEEGLTEGSDAPAIPDVDQMSDEEFAEWKDNASEAELRALLSQKVVVRGTRDYSRKSNDLAEQRRQLESQLESIFGDVAPDQPFMVQAPPPPPVAPVAPAPGEWVDPQVAAIQAQLAETQRQMQQMSQYVQANQAQQGKQMLKQEFINIADKYPWFATEGEQGVQTVLSHMKQTRTLSPETAFKALYVDRIAEEAAKAAVAQAQGQAAKVAGLPPTIAAKTRKAGTPAPPKSRAETLQRMAEGLGKRH